MSRFSRQIAKHKKNLSISLNEWSDYDYLSNRKTRNPRTLFKNFPHSWTQIQFMQRFTKEIESSKNSHRILKSCTLPLNPWNPSASTTSNWRVRFRTAVNPFSSLSTNSLRSWYIWSLFGLLSFLMELAVALGSSVTAWFSDASPLVLLCASKKCFLRSPSFLYSFLQWLQGNLPSFKCLKRICLTVSNLTGPR